MKLKLVFETGQVVETNIYYGGSILIQDYGEEKDEIAIEVRYGNSGETVIETHYLDITGDRK